MTVRALKQYLSQRSHDDLMSDIVDLFTKLDAVKDYYQMRLGGDSSGELLAKYKAAIQHEFFPARGYGQARLSIARKAITDYKRISPSIEDLVDLMLFYVEMGVAYTNAYGDINEPFYSSMETMYERAVELINKHNMQEQFAVRCTKIVGDTSSIGWGFHDTLAEIYDEHFVS